ncbi:uncharacterized protein LOC133728714 isoform X4 [Rosa rugosa]|uniref:uncharacterized protein LOC133728714 isoform X4 n=1 Tax=Rosa rugosa TaxID=74645 RepID=UPI002B401896|nr:uncharacterized protein LOC133728714 isoform X4 [Rosa rugosa]
MIDASDEFLSLSTKLFENREDLISDVRKIGLLQGYVMVIKISKDNSYVVMGCDRGGCYRTYSTLEDKKKNSVSRWINCPFKILGRRTAEGLWKVEISSLLHNHEPSTDMAGHPCCRRFAEEEALQVKQKEEQQDYQWALEMFSKLVGADNHLVAIITDRELALMKAIQRARNFLKCVSL